MSFKPEREIDESGTLTSNFVFFSGSSVFFQETKFFFLTKKLRGEFEKLVCFRIRALFVYSESPTCRESSLNCREKNKTEPLLRPTEVTSDGPPTNVQTFFLYILQHFCLFPSKCTTEYFILDIHARFISKYLMPVSKCIMEARN